MAESPNNLANDEAEVSFQNPPLIETATSVQFNPLPLLGNAMLAVFWDRHLRKEYPKPRDAGPIEPQVEVFTGVPPPRPQPVLRFGPHPAARLMLASEDDHWMVQIQNGRIVFNWRKLGTADYPRWSGTLPKFNEAYLGLKTFVQQEKLGSIQPDQWEVTYANHLVKGADWERPADWPDLLPGLLGRARFTDDLRVESAGGILHLEIVPQRGRLHVDLSHGLRRAGDKEEQILLLQLTARGSVEQQDDSSVFSGLKLGRSLVVKTFVQITGPAAHTRWGMQYVG